LTVYPRIFRMTAFNKSYDAKEGFARTYEMTFTTSRKGSIKTVRDTLARRGTRYFQQAIYRWHHAWLPSHKIRFGFLEEEQAEAVDRAIKVYIRSTRYRGKQYMATKLPPREISYARKSRRAKTRKGKRGKGR
jgi:hypothetical protein